jgi:class 3 adenylate cyclase
VPPAERQLTAVLFVDVVDATPLAVSLGDRAWAVLLERYYALVRTALARHHGTLVDTAGDGFFAVFDEPEEAVGCAAAVRVAAARLGVELRAGIHAGHCWNADAKCAGTDVHVGARIASRARAGEILVSEAAAARIRRTGIELADRGPQSLKGLPGRWRVFAAHPVALPERSSAAEAEARTA